MLIETLSTPLARALTVNHAYNVAFDDVNTFTVFPLRTDASAIDSDGIIRAGSGGEYSANRLFLMPFGDGVGAAFSMRLYGIRPASLPEATPGYVVWLPYLIVELACVTCSRNGPGPLPFQFLNTEYLCDTISFAQGQLGKDGSINSTGPGTNLAAYAVVDIIGSKELYFDFQSTDPVNMNCFWARA